MLRALLFAFAVSRCYADPITTTPPVTCRNIPPRSLYCIGCPTIVSESVMGQCTSYSECEIFKCMFRKSNWMDGDKIDTQKVATHFEQFAKDNPVWETVVQNIKKACLSNELPALGVHLNCPAYDILLCTMTAFLRNAPPSQWIQSSECEYPRQYAEECPICPSNCLQKEVPDGACNSCLVYPPRSTRG